jgi:hypothetical protein
MRLRAVGLDDLTIDDERSVSHLAIYRQLKQALIRSAHEFLIPVDGAPGRVGWDRVLFLNLTFWDAPSTSAPAGNPGGEIEGEENGADVLCDDHIAADEVAHVAWHHVVGRELARDVVVPAGPPSADALFFSESIASAFDLYLVGHLLRDAPDSDFITTQVPLMAERAQDAGLSSLSFAALIEETSRDPERAFEDMRTLLFDVSRALLACRGVHEANQALAGFVGHRFEPLLHHFEISNWILYARAYGVGLPGVDPIVARCDQALRQSPSAIDWLAEHWIDADLSRRRLDKGP